MPASLRAIISDSRFKDGAALKDELTSLRDELAERGVLLEDNPGGTRWKKK